MSSNLTKKGILAISVLQSMTDPARRHRCMECNEIFECHLCELDKEHSLHWQGFYLCEECAVEKGVLTVFSHIRPSEGCNHVEYDYLTGQIIAKHQVRRRLLA